MSTQSVTPLVLPPVTEVVYSFPLAGAQATFESKLSDMTIDVIEMAAGTYNFTSIYVNVDRTSRPLTIRPATPGTVTFAGTGGGGQFYIGLGGVAKYLTMQDFIFDGFTIGDTGVIWAGNVDHLTLNDFTVQNVTVTGSGPIFSWALYLSVDAGVSPTNVVIDRWTVTGSAHNYSALQVGHPPSTLATIHAYDWTVTDLSYAIYAYGTATDFLLDGWLIDNCVRAGTTDSVFFGADVTGVYSNMSAINGSGNLESQGGMTDGGGNSGL